MALPKDPAMLYSMINTKLRDSYDSLDSLCDDLGIDKDRLTAALHDAGFDYRDDINQFRCRNV